MCVIYQQRCIENHNLLHSSNGVGFILILLITKNAHKFRGGVTNKKMKPIIYQWSPIETIPDICREYWIHLLQTCFAATVLRLEH